MKFPTLLYENITLSWYGIQYAHCRMYIRMGHDLLWVYEQCIFYYKSFIYNIVQCTTIREHKNACIPKTIRFCTTIYIWKCSFRAKQWCFSFICSVDKFNSTKIVCAPAPDKNPMLSNFQILWIPDAMLPMCTYVSIRRLYG